MSEVQRPSVGRIVHFYPGIENETNNYKLPNGMEFAPAIIVQSFNDAEPYICNLVGFQAPRTDQGLSDPHFAAWSIKYQDYASEGEPYWCYPPRV